MNNNPRETILVVDDSPIMADTLGGILRPLYQVKSASNTPDALAIAQSTRPSLILLDVTLPGMGGHELCRRLKADLRSSDIPIILVSASSDEEEDRLGLELGAADYLHKPINPALLLHRVRIHLELRNQNLALDDMVRERTRELEDTRREIIRRLGMAGEYRDNETGQHVLRMSYSVRRLALEAGVPESQAELLHQTVPLHDIGKIGIPDHILLKPGNLNPEEWEIMKTHTLIGAEIIGYHDSPLLQMARSVALTHHEKWDGSGYPNGLAGEAIPLEGRIVAIADVYDALTCGRPYRKAWTSDDAFALIHNQLGLYFDPGLAALFLKLKPEIIEIGKMYAWTPSVPETNDGI